MLQVNRAHESNGRSEVMATLERTLVQWKILTHQSCQILKLQSTFVVNDITNIYTPDDISIGKP